MGLLSWFLVLGTDIIVESMEVGMWALWSHYMCGQEVPSNEGFCSAYVLFCIQSWYVSLLWLGLSGVLLEAFQELYPLEDSTPYPVIKTGHPRMNDQSHIKKSMGSLGGTNFGGMIIFTNQLWGISKGSLMMKVWFLNLMNHLIKHKTSS